jgi:hypothetical protein
LNPQTKQHLNTSKNNVNLNKQETKTKKKSLPNVQLDKMAIDFFQQKKIAINKMITLNRSIKP